MKTPVLAATVATFSETAHKLQPITNDTKLQDSSNKKLNSKRIILRHPKKKTIAWSKPDKSPRTGCISTRYASFR